VKEQPHPVRVGGQTVGDLDVLAVDPKSGGTLVAVTCKEWRDAEPHAKDFHHFLSLMEIEGIKYGIVAWTNIPSSVYPLAQNAEKRGCRILLLSREGCNELHNYILSGQGDRIGDRLRQGLGLVTSSAPTIGEEMLLRRAPPTLRRSVKCFNLLPLHYRPDPPSYVRNPYFSPETVRLLVQPFLLSVFHAHKEARVPRTGELIGEIDEEVSMVCDATTGKSIAQNDPVFQVVRNHYGEAYKHHTIDEEDFTVEVADPKIDRQGMTYRMRVDAVRLVQPITATYTVLNRQTEEEEEHEMRVVATPSDLRELFSDIIQVPIWHVVYHLKEKSYVREFFATNGSSIRDDMRYCLLCKEKETVAVCTKCGSTICAEHMLRCKTCGELFCANDSLKCVKCLSSYCKDHATGSFCVTCGTFMDTPCTVHCSVCNGPLCPAHVISCVNCGKHVCPKHLVEARYMLVKKQFCGDSCHKTYDAEYRQKGVLGKIGRVVKK